MHCAFRIDKNVETKGFQWLSIYRNMEKVFLQDKAYFRLQF